MTTVGGYARPRIHLQYHHKDTSVPTIRTVQADEDSDVIMDELDEQSPEGSSEVDEEEEEVDQLDSTEDEGEVQVQALAGQSAGATGASKPPRIRTRKHQREKALERSLAGHPPIPISRIENMLEADVSEPMSKESLFLLSAATEAFIQRLAEAGHRKATGMRRLTVTYHDVASAIQNRPELVFLEETIPQPLGLADALKRRETKEKELLEPLLSTPQPSLSISVPLPQSLSITLPLAHSISVPGSASASNAPSPRPSVQSVSQASASTSKAAGGKSRRKVRQTNGDASASANGVTPKTNVLISGNEIIDAVLPAAEDDNVDVTTSAPPKVPPMPRRQSLREPKPRRRPDGQEIPRPAPPPTTPTAVKEPKGSPSANGAAKAASAPARGGKARASRAKAAKGKTKAGDVSPASHLDSPTTTSTATPAKNGVSHSRLHTNGNGTMVTRSRRGSAAVVQPSVPNASPDAGPRSDDSKRASIERGAGHFTGPGSVLLDSPAPASFGGFARNGLTENPGRTIYSQHRSSAANLSR